MLQQQNVLKKFLDERYIMKFVNLLKKDMLSKGRAEQLTMVVNNIGAPLKIFDHKILNSNKQCECFGLGTLIKGIITCF